MVDKFVLQSLRKFMEVLPGSNNIELVVLKCHLLIEEELVKFINRSVVHPEHFAKAKLTFTQKIQVARCVCRDDIAPWLWAALSLLNQARNEIGHGLSNHKIKEKVDCFVEHVAQSEDVLTSLESSEEFTRFHYAALTVYSALSVHAGLRVSDMLFEPQVKDTAAR